MKDIIGFNIIAFAITLIVVVGLFGYELTKGEQLKMVIGEVIVMALLSIGVMLMF